MDLFLASILSCADGKWILDGIAQAELTSVARSELIVQVLQDMPDDCDHDDYIPEGRL